MLFIASGVLLYEVFKPASRRLALLFLILFEACAFIQSLNSIHNLAALLLVNGGPAMSGRAPAQANAMAFVFLKPYLLNLAARLHAGAATGQSHVRRSRRRALRRPDRLHFLRRLTVRKDRRVLIHGAS